MVAWRFRLSGWVDVSRPYGPVLLNALTYSSFNVCDEGEMPVKGVVGDRQLVVVASDLTEELSSFKVCRGGPWVI